MYTRGSVGYTILGGRDRPGPIQQSEELHSKHIVLARARGAQVTNVQPSVGVQFSDLFQFYFSHLQCERSCTKSDH